MSSTIIPCSTDKEFQNAFILLQLGIVLYQGTAYKLKKVNTTLKEKCRYHRGEIFIEHHRKNSITACFRVHLEDSGHVLEVDYCVLFLKRLPQQLLSLFLNYKAKRKLAFSMSQHPRLGLKSPVSQLPSDVLELILNM